MGRLERHLDLDLITKIKGGWKPSDTVLPLKRVKPIRSANSYRGARRNAARLWRKMNAANG